MSWFPNQPDDQGVVFCIILSQVLAAAFACVCIHIGSKFLMLQFYPDQFKALNATEQRTTQAECTSFVLTTFLVPFFIAGAVEVSGSIEERWNGASYHTYVAIVLTFGLTLYEEAMYLCYGRELIFHFHHLLVVVMFSFILYHPHLIFFVGWAATVETTGLFVNYFFIDKKLHPGKTNVIAGVLMWLSFLVFRMVSIPVCLLVALLDALDDPGIISQQSLAYLILNGFSALCVVLMSGLWFYKMTKGILKALKGAKEVAPAPAPVGGLADPVVNPTAPGAGATSDVEMAKPGAGIEVKSDAGTTAGVGAASVAESGEGAFVPAAVPVSVVLPVPDIKV